jgi:hypothetical protein
MRKENNGSNFSPRVTWAMGSIQAKLKPLKPVVPRVSLVPSFAGFEKKFNWNILSQYSFFLKI